MLQEQIELLFAHVPGSFSKPHFALFELFKDGLNSGQVRAAQPDPSKPMGWRVNPWVKKGILLGFRMGAIVDMSIDPAKQPFFDKETYPVKRITKDAGVRVVPGGSSIRDGAYIGAGVTCMPPMFVNVGAYVDDHTMVDSHALVGSCAQLGKRCHISAAAQIGGVLEPVGAMPVIIEDEVLVGGNCGVFEGTIVKRGAILGTGTILNQSTPVYDIVRGKIYSATETQPLVIPE
jgi:2,3,4,5-tetrahydropyridine-2,6-dicarboxylate N-succinyltransferase